MEKWHAVRTAGEGWRMENVSELLSEYIVTSSKCIVLECPCGEKVILLGYESDWEWEVRTVFGCSGCGKKLFLNDVVSKRVGA
jgi:hypothetical protein